MSSWRLFIMTRVQTILVIIWQDSCDEHSKYLRPSRNTIKAAIVRYRVPCSVLNILAFEVAAIFVNNMYSYFTRDYNIFHSHLRGKITEYKNDLCTVTIDTWTILWDYIQYTTYKCTLQVCKIPHWSWTLIRVINMNCRLAYLLT